MLRSVADYKGGLTAVPAGGYSGHRGENDHLGEPTFFTTVLLALIVSLIWGTIDPIVSRPAQALAVADTGANAEFTWSVPSRYEDSWKAWSQSTHTYDHNFIDPLTWSMIIDACASTGGNSPITAYSVTLEGVGFTHTSKVEGTECRHTITDLPRLGTYRATVAVQNATGWSAPVDRHVARRDYLIVTLGDSLASGEGNPDVPGNYSFDVDYVQMEVNSDVIRPAVWTDRQCHRSKLSGYALAAKAIEDRDPQTSVTYVNLACSGSETGHLYAHKYNGRDSSAGEPLKPQLTQLASLFRRNGEGGRHIDVLAISSGINNINFSGILSKCAEKLYFLDFAVPECLKNRNIPGRLEGISDDYAELKQRLDRDFDVGQVYMAGYPINPFKQQPGDLNNGACGYLSIKHVGLDGDEIDGMVGFGKRLLTTLQHSARANKWTYIDGMADKFLEHGYCWDKTWFVGFEESYRIQGDENGTVHPNGGGHATLRDMLLDAIVLVRDDLRCDAAPKPQTTATSHITLPAGPSAVSSTIPCLMAPPSVVHTRDHRTR